MIERGADGVKNLTLSYIGVHRSDLALRGSAWLVSAACGGSVARRRSLASSPRRARRPVEQPGVPRHRMTTRPHGGVPGRQRSRATAPARRTPASSVDDVILAIDGVADRATCDAAARRRSSRHAARRHGRARRPARQARDARDQRDAVVARRGAAPPLRRSRRSAPSTSPTPTIGAHVSISPSSRGTTHVVGWFDAERCAGCARCSTACATARASAAHGDARRTCSRSPRGRARQQPQSRLAALRARACRSRSPTGRRSRPRAAPTATASYFMVVDCARHRAVRRADRADADDCRRRDRRGPRRRRAGRAHRCAPLMATSAATAASSPRSARGVFLAETCAVIGDVVIGDESSIWYGTVVRGDVMPIRIGARTSIQDNTVIHVTSGLLGHDRSATTARSATPRSSTRARSRTSA